MALTAPVHDTDRAVQQAVMAELEYTPNLDEARIGVAVSDGVVVLGGEVDTLSERYIAVKAAQKVAGVVSVVDEILVTGEPGVRFSDIEIAKRITAVLSWLNEQPYEKVRAEVTDGQVILSGNVEYNYQRRAAEKLVSTLAHVRAVENRIILMARPYPADFQEQLLEALRRQGSLDVSKMSVHIQQGDVYLGGIVSTAQQKHDAEQAVWKHPAVKDVHNDIRVIPDLQ
ncbi:BON domain-containing protein [Herbiconiux sp. VKM Ac-1786]|uniref:BON domain-containing protein n=1 Tax=Herbiconiux sp. VKM Ac-1786 TaxID=2783824 RepID=UPI00188A69B5|nr:BON domain-containing protein [Herbiconiux sp. VKM Ac-1786]MBF4571946.1 BON domain-containing protein [Herbiconiux sp. VKM Ac-1786]